MQKILLGLSVAVNIVLGLLIFYRAISKKSTAGLFMSASILFVILWTIGDYLLLFGRTEQVVNVGRWMWVVVPMLGILMLFSFARIFLYRLRVKHRLSPLSLSFPLAALWILFFALFPDKAIADISISATGLNKLQTAPIGFQFYTLFFSLYFSATILMLYIKYKKLRGIERIQAQYLLAGTSLMLISATVTNLIFPSFFGSLRLIWLGPIFSIFYIAFYAYAIIKHQLFDIRSFVVRAIAYGFTLTLTALLYVIPAVFLTNYLLGLDVTTSTLLALSIGTLLVAVLFEKLKVYFNKFTNRLFYRDYYEPQEVLDNLSNLLVGSVSVKEIKDKSSAILKDALRPLFIEYLLLSEKQPKNKNILQLLVKKNTEIISLDELPPGDHSALHEEMIEKDAAIAVRLRTRHEALGYLIMGYRQSGSIYTQSDKKLLGIVADEIAIGLQNALRFEEIEQFNVTLQQKIDDATLKLKHANTRLKELDEAKDEFVSMASHQLRTPLTVIKGYLSMLLEGDMGKVTKQQKEIIQTAYDGAERMVFLIGDLLNVSRLQTGKFQIENQSSDLSAVIDHEVSHLQESAANHQLKLTFDKPKDFPKFMLDETKIRQVIMNFIDNAIYYTPAGGSIDVKLETTDHEILFTVNDTGLGVPKAEQHHLFSKFYRAGNARKMRPDGTGLGLYMAKKIIVAQGGAIIFKSEEGKGSTFGFSLPKKAVGQ